MKELSKGNNCNCFLCQCDNEVEDSAIKEKRWRIYVDFSFWHEMVNNFLECSKDSLFMASVIFLFFLLFTPMFVIMNIRLGDGNECGGKR